MFPSNIMIWVKITPYDKNDLTKDQWHARLNDIGNDGVDKQLLSKLYDGVKIPAAVFNEIKQTTIPLLTQLLPGLDYDLQVKM